MFAFRAGHQHLSWVTLLAVPLLLAFVIGSPIPHPLFDPGAPTSAKPHVGLLAEVAATASWVAWGAGLVTQIRRRRKTSPAHMRIKPNGPMAGTADRFETLRRNLDNHPCR